MCGEPKSFGTCLQEYGIGILKGIPTGLRNFKEGFTNLLVLPIEHGTDAPKVLFDNTVYFALDIPYKFDHMKQLAEEGNFEEIGKTVGAGITEIAIGRGLGKLKAAPKIKPGQKIGGSGRPISPTVKHATRKRAQDAARAETAKGKRPVHHKAKDGQPAHYHGVNSKGKQKATHHDHP